MVNLLLTGKAASNVHDGSVSLEGGPGQPCLVLKGIDDQSTVGFLSLFEHYGSMEVSTAWCSICFSSFGALGLVIMLDGIIMVDHLGR